MNKPETEDCGILWTSAQEGGSTRLRSGHISSDSDSGPEKSTPTQTSTSIPTPTLPTWIYFMTINWRDVARINPWSILDSSIEARRTVPLGSDMVSRRSNVMPVPKCCRVETPVGVAVGHILSTPIPSPVKTYLSAPTRLRPQPTLPPLPLPRLRPIPTDSDSHPKALDSTIQNFLLYFLLTE